MALIFETENFTVDAEDNPLIDRLDGGHITINPKFKIGDRQHLNARQAIELMRLTIVAGRAMAIVMNRHGVDIGRINYQDNGNWSVLKPEGPQLHVHLYGRAKSARKQPYGQSCYFPHKNEQPEFYADLQSLNGTDIEAIKNEMELLFQLEKFSDAVWKL